MSYKSLEPSNTLGDFSYVDDSERSQSLEPDAVWGQSWFGASHAPSPRIDDFNDDMRAALGHHPEISPYADRPLATGDRPIFGAATLSEAEPIGQTLRPSIFVRDGQRAVTPFEVVSDLRETLAQHVYLDGLRPWLTDTGDGARGGISRIHFLNDELLHRQVAMKTLDGKRGQAVHELGLLKEAIVTGQLTHPGIPPVYDLWMSPAGECRFSMKKIEGRTLSEIVEAAPPGRRTITQLESQLQIVIRVCDALSFAHDHGVLHRDVKPSNVMAGDHGEVFLMDWGCAHVNEAEPPKRGIHLPKAVIEALRAQGDAIVGTPSFMAPEQVTGQAEDLSPRTDVYLLGGLLYFVLTGVAPRAKKSTARDAIEAAADGFVHNPFSVAPHAELPAKLMEVARKALDPDPLSRYASARDFQDVLREVVRDGMWLSSMCASNGEIIYHEGDEADAVYLIKKGHVRMFKHQFGRPTEVRTLAEGEVFGEAAFYTHGRRDQTVEAVGNTVLLRVPKRVFEQVLYPGSCLQEIVRAIAVRQRAQ